MSRLSVKEYATLNNISVQSVYKKIKNGTLESHTINNTKYIIIDDVIDYEKKFIDLQLKYDNLQSKYELLKNQITMQNEFIQELKESRKFLAHLIEYKKEVVQPTTKEKKKSKKNKDIKKKKKK